MMHYDKICRQLNHLLSTEAGASSGNLKKIDLSSEIALPLNQFAASWARVPAGLFFY